jgi:hypothetical protein
MPSWDPAPATQEPSWGSAFPVHTKLGSGDSEPGAELGLGVPGGSPRFFPLTTFRRKSNHRGSGGATDSVSRKGAKAKPASITRNAVKTWEYRVTAVNKVGEGGLYR